jgi:hypothetical protein
MVLNNGRVARFRRNVDEYSMFDGPDNLHFQGFADEAVRGNNETSALARLFFSKDNINILQEGIRFMVYKESGGKHIIGRQSEIELKVVMRSVFFDYAKHLKYDMLGQTKDLNAIVLKEVVPKIVTEVDMYERYKRDVTTLADPMPRSLNMSMKGSKSLELKRL